MRVIAGRLRGRVLKAPAGDATRPTGARVKEALFAILGDVQDERVLDLYSGSGALGIEALSRGAGRAVFVESARPALACLRQNLAALGLEAQSRVLPVRVEAVAGKLGPDAPFDLLLCDPPWRDMMCALEQVDALAASGLLGPSARVVVEHSAKERLTPTATLTIIDERQWGDTAVTLLALAQGPVVLSASPDP